MASKKKKKTKKVAHSGTHKKKCSLCRKPGHNARTCGRS